MMKLHQNNQNATLSVIYIPQDKSSEITADLIKGSGPGSQRQGSEDGNHVSPLTLQHYQSILYILVTVWGASGVILLLELLIYHHKCRSASCHSMLSN